MNTEKEQKEIEEKWQTERLEKQINFIREMDKEKFIGRQTYLSDGKRKENDAEHAWHLALMTLLLSEYANEKIDTLKTMTMLMRGTHTLTMKKGKRHRPKENKKPQKDFMACCQKTREQN